MSLIKMTKPKFVAYFIIIFLAGLGAGLAGASGFWIAEHLIIIK